jgi:anti-sigma factor ChrR (cupin superfamily)
LIKETFMAETGKKTKATAKPRKAPTKKLTVAEAPKTAAPSPDEIKQLAEKYWASRGYQEGHAEQDWLRAEQELRGKAS